MHCLSMMTLIPISESILFLIKIEKQWILTNDTNNEITVISIALQISE